MFKFDILRNLHILFKKKRDKHNIDSEAKYRDIVEHSIVGVYIIQDNYFRYVNKKFCEIFGYSYEEIVDKISPIFLAFEDDKSIVKNNIRKRFSKELTSIEYEFRGVKKDGSLIWIRVLGNLITYNEKPAISGTLIDITDHKKVEDALYIGEERLRVTLEATKIGTWDWDVENDIWIASSIYYTMLGYEPIAGPSDRGVWLTRIHPDDREYVKTKINDVLAHKEESYIYEARMLHADGSYRWHQVTGHTIEKDNQGRIKRIVGIRKDITDFKQAEEELKKSKSRLRALIDTIPDLVWLKDPQGVFLQCNQRFEQLYGATENEIVGKTDFSFVSKELSDFFRQKDIEAIVAGKPTKNEEEVTFADGHKEIIETIKTPIYENNGAFMGVLGIGRDITQRKKTEVELIKAKERAEESDRLKTAFLQNMSHEIRTPMNAIMGFSGLLLSKANNPGKLKQYTGIITQRCNDLLDIINDILDISKIESGQFSINIVETNLEELFAELSDFFNEYQKRINKEQIEFILHVFDTHEDNFILTDKVKLMQIFINLISNAFKFTDEGKIECGCKFDTNHDLLFYVTDTGIGIPEDKHQYVFERFAQLQQETKRNIGGTGLGLSIVKALVNLLGGQVFLESEPGKGSTFSFTIPYKPYQRSFPHASEPDGINYENYLNKTILVVEDDYYNAKYIDEILSDIGLNILHAENGKQAIEISLSKPIDLILMDIRLPDMDGYEATRQIIKHKTNLKIVAQTAYAAHDEKQKAFAAGCVNYISKPIKLDDLLSILNKHLRHI